MFYLFHFMFFYATDGLIYGVTDNGRYLFVVGINKGKGVFRAITARDMTEREKSLYKRRSKR